MEVIQNALMLLLPSKWVAPSPSFPLFYIFLWEHLLSEKYKNNSIKDKRIRNLKLKNNLLKLYFLNTMKIKKKIKLIFKLVINKIIIKTNNIKMVFKFLCNNRNNDNEKKI